jgi:hypothetical protein
LQERKRKEKVSVDKMVKAIKMLHEIVSIFYAYDDKLFRPLRFVLVYERLLLIIAIAALFSQSLTLF